MWCKTMQLDVVRMLSNKSWSRALMLLSLNAFSLLAPFLGSLHWGNLPFRGFVVIGSALRPTGLVVQGLHKVQSVLSTLLAMISTSILLTSSLSFVSTTTSAPPPKHGVKQDTENGLPEAKKNNTKRPHKYENRIPIPYKTSQSDNR
jgi:hypothetical protein